MYYRHDKKGHTHKGLRNICVVRVKYLHETKEKPRSWRIRPIFRSSDRGKWEKSTHTQCTTVSKLHSWNFGKVALKRTKNVRVHKINKGESLHYNSVNFALFLLIYTSILCSVLNPIPQVLQMCERVRWYFNILTR